MKELLRTSPHQPVEKVVVHDHLVPSLLASGQYKEVGDEKSMFDKAESPDFTPSENVHNKEDVFFNKDMEEKDIKAKIEKYKIPVKYNISNDDKEDKLKELEKLGYNVDWK